MRLVIILSFGLNTTIECDIPPGKTIIPIEIDFFDDNYCEIV